MDILSLNNMEYWITGGVLVIAMYRFYCFKYWALKNVAIVPSKFTLFPMIIPHVYAGKFYLPSKLDVVECYEEMKKLGLKYAGVVTSTLPLLIIADLDDIANIFKDVEYFEDRGFLWSDRYFPLEESKCTFLDGRQWKEMSDKLTPDSSSGRIKNLFQTVLEKTAFLTGIFQRCAMEREHIDVREVLSCFTANIIMQHTFEVSCNNLISSAWLNTPIFSCISTPGVKSTMERVSEYLYYNVRKAMRCRESNEMGKVNFLGISSFMRNWITNSPYAHRTGTAPYLYQMVSNYGLFFQESFDTSCTTTNFAIYELCRNMDIQEKVRQEINEVLRKHNGKFTLDSLSEMIYLSQIINETLRMYPPAANIVKFVYHKNYVLGNKDLTLSRNTAVVIPVFSLHRDADFVLEPEKFDPERFSKSSGRSPLLFMPFGEGLLDCKSIHATLLLSKVSLVTILSQFRLRISPKTEMPLQVDPKTFLKPTKTLYITAETL